MRFSQFTETPRGSLYSITADKQHKQGRFVDQEVAEASDARPTAANTKQKRLAMWINCKITDAKIKLRGVIRKPGN